MTLATRLVVLALVAVLLVGAAGPAAAHGWQTTVTQGPMELGVSSSPETPVAGMETEFAARIADSDVAEGEANRLDWGGVVDTQVEVHIRGPDGYHDHVTATVPEDDAHFHFTYVFPEGGTYSIAVVTELEGEEYAFEFTKNVTLLPARATGAEMEHLSEDVHAVGEDVDTVKGDVSALKTQVADLQAQLDRMEQAQMDAEEESADVAQAPGFGATAAIAALVAVLAFAVGRRT